MNEVIGFTVAGEDQVFHHAQAQILGQGAQRNQNQACDSEAEIDTRRHRSRRETALDALSAPSRGDLVSDPADDA